MNIWIDLANSPHVVFFRPIVTLLEQQGHHVTITLRDFAQTVPLARQCGLDGEVIGRHAGKNRVKKVGNLASRALQLAKYARGRKIDIAVSHNSYAQNLAGRLIGAKIATLMDYEGQPANHLAFRLAHRVIVPDCFPQKALRRFGVAKHSLYRYRGFKEQVYLSNFTPSGKFVDDLVSHCDLPSEWTPGRTTIVTVRPPATMAAYHTFQNPLFTRLLGHLDENRHLTVIVLPRTQEQAIQLKATHPRFHIPCQPLDGNNLVHLSDMVIGAGGTMNREAAVLGTPAFTIFAGSIPAVDKKLISLGRMKALRREEDLNDIGFAKKQPGTAIRNCALTEELVGQITSLGGN